MPKRDALAELKAAHAAVDKVPEGWRTATQWAEALGTCRDVAYDRIDRLVQGGTWGMRKYRVLVRGGKVVAIPHFGPI